MKTFFYYLLTAFVALSSFQSLQAQDKDTDKGYGGHWFLGLSGGAAWQQSDVKTQLGGGWSLYLGKNIFYSPTAPLSFDLRLRYLGTQTFGQDWQTTNIASNPVLNGSITNAFGQPDYSSTGFVYHNHRTGFHDLSLEGRLNFENLRRKHRIWLSLYGGVGVGWYRVAYDQVDERVVFDDNYTSLYGNVEGNTSLSRTEIVDQLIAGRDGDYETWMDGSFAGDYKATFTPSLGFELGYWITPRFAMGIGHRVNLTFQDNFDGVSRGGGIGDIHHYANLFMHFRLSGGNTTRVKPTPNPNHIVNPVVAAPQVDITTPGSSPSTVNQNPTRIRATIRNVETATGVQLVVNGINTSIFSFNPATDILEANVSLNVGANTIQVVGTNSAGTAQDQVTIIYQQPQTQTNPPTVNITNPAANPHTTQNPTQTINATITNIDNIGNVTFTVNGQPSRNFTLNGTSFTAVNVPLNQGSNNVVISATNNDGTANDNVIINYQPVQANPPTVNITTPSANPYNTSNPSETIRATINNVPSRNNVTFTVNGQNLTNFTFSGTSFTATNIALNQGINTIRVSGFNNDGNAFDEVTINYQPTRVPTPPTVQITEPSANPYNTQNPSQTIRATINNVPSRTGVTFTINGQTSSNFSFSGTSFVATNVTLQQGSNTIQITGVNNDGTASDDVIINYQPARVPNPPTVNITNPAANPYNTQNPTQIINATITNVPSRNNVTFTLNGQTISNFSLNGTAFTATNISLQQGANTVRIVGTNEDGAASDDVVINYQPVRVPNPPTVNITNPAANPYTAQNPTQTINATITNVASSNNVTFTLNGQTISNFSLNGTAFTATNVSLQQGSNTVVISASNQDGNASDNTVIIYKPIPTAPSIGNMSVTVSPIRAGGGCQVTVNATLVNVTDASQIRFTVGGQVVTNFIYRTGGIFQYTYTVNSNNPASVNYVITATTPGGTVTDTRTGDLSGCGPQVAPPVVTITQPSSNPYQSPNPTTDIRATILNVANSSGVAFTVNGQNVTNFSFSGTSFSANGISLNQGNNTISITGTNSAGSDNKSTVIIYKPIPTAPSIGNMSVTVSPIRAGGGCQVTVNATLANVTDASQIRFTVGGQVVTNFNYRTGGIFQYTYTVNSNNPASVNYVITATTPGGTVTDTRTGDLSGCGPQVAPPVVTITQPSSNPYQSPNPTTDIRATILNVANSSGVAFTVNGQNVTNFSFSGTSFSANGISLNQGNNTISITGTNSAGSDNKSTVIIYKPIPTAPSIGNMSVTVSPIRAGGGCQVTVNATLTNVTDASQIRFTVGGQVVTNFNYRTGGIFQYTYTVNSNNPASVNYVITATTPGGTVTDTRTGDLSGCGPQVAPPVVTITLPNANPYNTNAPTENIRATILNVTNSSGVTFTVNGQNLTNFSFSGTSFTASGVALNAGNNTISITGNNSAGSDSKSTVIIRNVLPAPTVNITNPSANPHNTQTATQTINATITNVANANNVTFTVNNVPNRNFTLSGNVFTAPNIRLNQGNNTIVITGTNPQGSANDQTVINYTVPVSPPVVTITQPNSNPYQSATQRTDIRATILNVASSSDVSFLVNGQTVSNFSFSGTSFSANAISLNQGNNTISITGRNTAGQDSKSTVIIYKPMPAAPSIGNMSVTVSPIRTGGGCQVTINATLQNVTSANEIRFTVNGQVVTDFNYRTGGIFQYTYTVNNNNPASVNYVITATTGGGTATETRTGDLSGCGPQVAPPDVMNTSVTVAPERNFCIATVTSRIINIENANQITFMVNGQRNTNFTFNNGVFNARVDVSTITNTSIPVIITATNTAGTDTESAAGDKSTCNTGTGGGNNGTIVNPNNANTTPKPTITFTSPRLGSASSDKILVSATLTGISTSNRVGFKVNGVTNSGFQITGGGTGFRAENVQLREGNNVLEITATNAGGTETKTFNVNYTASGSGGGSGSGSNTGDRPAGGGDNNTGGGKGGKLGGDKNTENPPSKGGKLGGDK